MPRVNPIQPSFAGGEYSPSLYSRVDIQKYSTGLRRCRNFIVHPHGGASNRPGIKFVEEAKFSDRVCRVVRFIFSTTQTYVFEVGHHYIRFFTNQAQITEPLITDNGIGDDVILALHFDGTNNSTTFTDSSTLANTITPHGDAKILTAQSKFGGASGYFDGTGDYLTTADFPELDLGTNDVTIDAWVRRDNTSGNHMICSRVTGGSSYFYFGFEGLDLRFRDYVSGDVINIIRTVSMSANTWYHVAYCRSGNSHRLFLDGAQQGATVTSSATITARAVGMEIGSMSADGSYLMKGYIDELRVSNGTAYFTADFTPSTSAYSTPTTSQIPYEITTPYTEDDLSLLRFESSADVIFITSPDFQTQTLSRFGDTDWRLEDYAPTDGPFMAENLDDGLTLAVSAVSGTGVTVNASDSLFAALHVGALFKLKHYIGGNAVSSSFTGTGTSSSIKCFTTWRLITHGTWTGKFRIEKSSDGGSSWTTLRTFSSSADFNANTSGTEDPETNSQPFLVRINMYSYSSGTLNLDLTTDPFFQEGIIQITTVTTDILANADVIQEVGNTTATASWSEGSWSDYRGWPSVARFFQDRLCFSGTYSEPMTTWMTKLGNYYSFVRNVPLLDTDAISTNLPSRQLNAINGLVALKKLLAFTSGSEWTIGPVSGEVLAPKSIEQSVEGYRGSYGLDPAIVGDECIFMQANGKVVRNIGFQLQSDGFTGSELNILARHLFQKFTIIEIAYQQDPDSVVWCLRDDGILLGMTYMKEQEVVAWSWHDTDGDIESICVIPGEGFDELWMSVRRENGRFIERMTQRSVSVECGGEREIKVQNQLFLDSAVSYESSQDIEDITVNDDGDVVVFVQDHGFTNGDSVYIECVEGMTDVNDKLFTVNPGTGDTDTLLLLHFDGADNDAATTDSSTYARAISRVGTPVLDTAKKVFGTTSSYFPADGGTGEGGGVNYWSIGTSPDFGSTFWNGDWTLEGRYNFEINNAGSIFFFSWLQNAFSLIQFSYSFLSNRFTFNHHSGITNVTISPADTWVPTLGTFYAISIVKSGTSYSIYVDGEIITGAITEATSLPSMSAVELRLGTDVDGTPNRAFQGWMDEVRISKVARYSGASYDLATRPFNDATNSLVLYLGATPISGVGYGAYIGGGHLKTAVSDFSGLDHLEGQTVGILADGFVQEQQTVVDGAITLDGDFAVVHVGLPYYSDLETLNIELPLKEGTTQGRKVKIGNVTFRLVDSRGGWIGPNENKLHEAITTDFTGEGDSDTGTPPPLFTGDVRVPLGAGYEDGGRIFYRQVDPLPVTITAVIPEIQIGGQGIS